MSAIFAAPVTGVADATYLSLVRLSCFGVAAMLDHRSSRLKNVAFNNA
jgi:hypothetical protein